MASIIIIYGLWCVHGVRLKGEEGEGTLDAL